VGEREGEERKKEVRYGGENRSHEQLSTMLVNNAELNDGMEKDE
jgi:hypothetical protein